MATFDQMLVRIEEINQRIHDSRLTVQEKTDLYCEAVELIRLCKKGLVAAHERVMAGRDLMESVRAEPPK